MDKTKLKIKEPNPLTEPYAWIKWYRSTHNDHVNLVRGIDLLIERAQKQSK